MHGVQQCLFGSVCLVCSSAVCAWCAASGQCVHQVVHGVFGVQAAQGCIVLVRRTEGHAGEIVWRAASSK